MLVGYVRTAHKGDTSSLEGASLRDAGCELVFADSTAERPELGKALERLGPQDVLLVTGLDRLAGDLPELIGRMVQVQAKGASIRTLQLQRAKESASASAKELLDALLSFERQSAGARSRQKQSVAQEQSEPRPRLLDDAAMRLVATRAHAGEPVPEIARSIGVSAQELRRALRADRKSATGEAKRSQ